MNRNCLHVLASLFSGEADKPEQNASFLYAQSNPAVAINRLIGSIDRCAAGCVLRIATQHSDYSADRLLPCIQEITLSDA
jgi:hypothetical protein